MISGWHNLPNHRKKKLPTVTSTSRGVFSSITEILYKTNRILPWLYVTPISGIFLILEICVSRRHILKPQYQVKLRKLTKMSKIEVPTLNVKEVITLANIVCISATRFPRNSIKEKESYNEFFLNTLWQSQGRDFRNAIQVWNLLSHCRTSKLFLTITLWSGVNMSQQCDLKTKCNSMFYNHRIRLLPTIREGRIQMATNSLLKCKIPALFP